MAKKKTESDAVREICEWLELRKFFFWRNNNIPVFGRSNDGEKRFRAMPKYSMKGVSDIIVLHRGKFIGLEVKGPNANKYTDTAKAQVEFGERVKMNGGAYYVVHSSIEAELIPEFSLHPPRM